MRRDTDILQDLIFKTVPLPEALTPGELTDIEKVLPLILRWFGSQKVLLLRQLEMNKDATHDAYWVARIRYLNEIMISLTNTCRQR